MLIGGIRVRNALGLTGEGFYNAADGQELMLMPIVIPDNQLQNGYTFAS